MKVSSLPSANPPIELEGTKLTDLPSAAAGLKAVFNSLTIATQQMGVGRATKALLKLNQKNGFDCQSCAWPSPDENRNVAEFCENGAKALADEAMTAKITHDFFRKNSLRALAKKSDFWLGKQGRLIQPMVLRENSEHYEPITWDEAFAMLASELNTLATPNEASFYTSGRTSNEAAFLYQLFVRIFGTNNLPDCSNMCHESSGAALMETIGIGKGCVTLTDIEHAGAIFIIGQNPGTNHPRMLSSLQVAKRNGAKIVSLNPMPEIGTAHFRNPQDMKNPWRIPEVVLGNGTTLCDLWLPVRINGDMAAMQGIMKELLADEEKNPGSVFDWNFIRNQTGGSEALIENLRSADWDLITSSSGLNRQQIRSAADIAREAKSIVACWAMGLTQHKQAVATIQEVMNFLLLRGNIGRPGAGPCPVRGHSNVQGDRTMGIFEKPSAAFLDALAKEFGFEPPRDHGFDVVDSIKAMHDGRVKFFFAMGGNFLSASPDTDFTAEALRRCRLTAHVATKLNRSHLITGKTALILPCLGRSEVDFQASGEQFVTVEDSMGIVNSSRGMLRPAAKDLLSEPAIVAGLAKAVLGEKTSVDWAQLAGNYALIRDHIEKVVPGFEDFNSRIEKGPFYLPNKPRDARQFDTPSGKAVFTVHPIPEETLQPNQLMMMTIRTHDQFNTTIYGLDDRYRGVFNGRRVIFMNYDDMTERSLIQGQLVDLTSHFQGEQRIAPKFMVAPYNLPKRCVATYFPEANILVPINSVAEISHTPTSKSVVVTVSPSKDADRTILDLHRDLID